MRQVNSYNYSKLDINLRLCPLNQKILFDKVVVKLPKAPTSRYKFNK